MPRRLIAAIIIFLLAGGITAYKLYFNKTEGITATGTIEVTRADITPKTSGYLKELKIIEGDTVKRSQVIATIGRPDLEAQKLRDEAALAKAAAQLRDLEKGARNQEIIEARGSAAGALAVYERTKADFERYQALYQQGAISTQQLDAARSAYQVAGNSLESTTARASLIEEGSRQDAIEAQRLEVERSKAVVALAQTALDDTVLTSPSDGLVLTKNYEPGEFVNAGAAVATIGDMKDCWVKIYISSTQLGLIKVGQQVEVKVDSFPNRTFVGQIKEISQNAEFTPRQSITKHERANLVFAVKVKIANDEMILKPGMPADVVIK